jgi:uncharacterized protein (DUF305 family)
LSQQPPLIKPMRAARLSRALCVLAVLAATGTAIAHDAHHHDGSADASSPRAFVASTAKPFNALMDDAMDIMEHGMATARMTGNPDADFINMMIPHHQGAVDMAKALLLYSQDPELKNLAQEIATEQQVEITLMRNWLARHAKSTGPAHSEK